MALVAVSNKRVILKRYLTACEIGQLGDEMEVVTAEAVPLSVPAGSSAVLVKNLYISCDPYLRNRTIRHEVPTYISDFVPGEVMICIMSQYKLLIIEYLLCSDHLWP